MFKAVIQPKESSIEKVLTLEGKGAVVLRYLLNNVDPDTLTIAQLQKDMAANTGLSTATIAEELSQLLNVGLIKEVQRGRPSTYLINQVHFKKP